MIAPSVGGALRVLRMAEAGQAVKEGDVILEFDPADQQYALEQAAVRSCSRRSRRSSSAAPTPKRRRRRTRSRCSPRSSTSRRAELDAAVDAGSDSRRTTQDSASRPRRGQARRWRKRAGRQGTRGRRTRRASRCSRRNARKPTWPPIGPAEHREPRDEGADERRRVRAREPRCAQGASSWGMSLPPYRVGDTVNPGSPVIDVFDVASMEVRARVNEQDRANVEVGQTMNVTSKIAPDSPPLAKVVSCVRSRAGRIACPARCASSKSPSSSRSRARRCGPGRPSS